MYIFLWHPLSCKMINRMQINTNTPDDGRLCPKHVEWLCRNKYLHSVAPKLVFHLTYTMMHANTKLKYLRKFHCCFIKKHTNCKAISKPRLTKGIQTSCNQKKELYLKMRDNNEMKHKLYYKQYCKILTSHKGSEKTVL